MRDREMTENYRLKAHRNTNSASKKENLLVMYARLKLVVIFS